jgi:hypothetical protein
MGQNQKALILSLLFSLIFCISSYIHADDTSYTLSDVAAAQDNSSSDISSIAASVSSTTQFNGMTQSLAYDYQMATDTQGNQKIMVTTQGVFAMQFLVDTSDMSVTFLMADGSQQKVTASADVKAQVEQLAGLGGLNGLPGRSNLYAALGMKKDVLSDATYKTELDTDRLETNDTVISVKGKKGNGRGMFGIGKGDDMADVEYDSKKTQDAREKFEQARAKIEATTPKNQGAAEYKKRALKWFQDNEDKALKSMMGKRVEHINMRTGMVEEQEMYNPGGDKTGHIRVTNKMNVKDRKSGKTYEMASEMETEMTGMQGDSKTTTRINNTSINEPVSFTWMKTKKKGE